MLAAGKPGKAVAAEMGVTEETISRRKQDKEFKLDVTKLLTDAHETAKARMQIHMEKAVIAVENSLDDTSLTAKGKFAIAVKIIEMCSYYNSRLACKVAQL